MLHSREHTDDTHPLSAGPRTALLVAFALSACTAACEGAEVLTPPLDGPSADFEVSVSVSDIAPTTGSLVTFTITGRNLGPNSAENVFVGDSVTAGLSYESHSATVGEYSPTSRLWEIGSLEVDAVAELQIVARVDAAAGTGITRWVGITSNTNPDSVVTNNIASTQLEVAGGGTPPPPPPAGVVFSSTWSTATGTSSSALRDGNRWDDLYCGNAGQTLAVVPGTAVGWTRTPNVLRLQQMGASICGMLEKVNAVPVSTTHYGRFYFRNDETSTTHNHVATYFPVGDIQVAIWNRAGRSDGVELFMRTYKDASGQFAGWPYSYWKLAGSGNNIRLQNGTWYRYEWMMEYVSANTYRLWPRIYNMAGTLLYDADDYYNSDYPSNPRTLRQHYDMGNVFGVSSTSSARNLGLGSEGPAGSSSTGGYWYHADVALSTAGWIGQ
jgi:uncharacterized repeat protein (TIGR01451 family)